MNNFEFRDPTRFLFNDFVGHTVLHPVAVVLLAIAILFFLLGDRKHWFLVMGLVVCNLSSAQRVVVFGVDFHILRIVGVAGLVLLIARGHFRSLKPAPLDKILFASLLIPAILAPIRGQSSSSMAYLGFFVDGISIYFIGRLALRDLKDVSAFAGALLLISIPITIAMIIEKFTGRNFFSIFGGIPELTPVRMGKLRTQGAFAHSIIAGCWFAASLPIVISQWRGNINASRGKMIAVFGSLLAVICVFATESSTPIAGTCVALIALLIYPFKNSIKTIRPFVIFLAFVVHFVSTSGIHHILYTRFAFVAGSTGYHRFKLVDAAIEQFPTWFLIGTNGTYSWGYGLDDVTQQFVQAGVAGGLVGLTLLVLVLVISYKNAGSLMRSENPKVVFVGYCLGVSILVHTVAYLGVTYFGQIQLLLYFTLGGLQTLSMNLGSKPVVSTTAAQQPSRFVSRIARTR